MKPGTKKFIECYVDADFTGRCNQEEVKDPGLVPSITGYVITYANCPIIQVSWLQTEMYLSTTVVKYIALSKTMMNILPFVV